MLYGITDKIKVSDIIYDEDDIVDGIYGSPDTIYIFGDNIVRAGKGGQAVIRDATNSFGIVTKRLPSRKPSAYLSDKNYKVVSRIIGNDIYHLVQMILSGSYSYIHIPKGGLGTGLADMKGGAPKLYTHLSELLYVSFKYTNPGWSPY